MHRRTTYRRALGRATQMTLAALAASGWAAGEGLAAAPQPDPMTPPAISVSATNSYAHNGMHPADGDTLTATPGGWSGIDNSYEYQWQSCSSATAPCSDIAGATSPSFVPDTLFGTHVRVAVTATNPDGSTTAFSAATARLADGLPHLIDSGDPARVTGSTREGDTLTLDAVSKYRTASRPIAAGEITWVRCDSTHYASPCATVTGATSTTYTLQAADVGKVLHARATIFNGAGHANPNPAVTAPVGPVTVNTDPPSNTEAPTITAPTGAIDGEILQGSPGTWSGGKPIGYAYQWLRCDGEGAECVEVPGQTASQYRAQSGDVGRRMRLRVTATSSYGTQSATSEPSAAIAPAPPASVTAPAVSGTARDGQILSGSPGEWRGTAPIERVQVWERCDENGAGCANIDGATTAAYTLVPEDIGHRLRFKEVASNAAGTTAARSAATAVVAAIAPAATELPQVTGLARDEELLDGSLGTWTGSPTIAHARQWMRCAGAGSPADCTAIAGATARGYTITSADVGSRIRLRVIASNYGNETPAFSEPTDVVAALAPYTTAPPVVSGSARDGATLTATRGSWGGTGPISTAYRWERCDGDGTACAPIGGAASDTYLLTGEDVGRRVRAVVVATGPGGSTQAPSAPGDPVAAVAPQPEGLPELAGTARDAEVLTTTEGAWSGTHPMTRTVRWERCDGSGDTCVAIAGASGAAYTLTPADVGHRLRSVVTAANAGGEAAASSAASAIVVAIAPQSTEPPAISGTARDGEVLSGTTGTWTGTPAIALARQWLRCSDREELGSCEIVPGATAPGYELGGDDVGSHVRLRVTASNAGHSVVGHSATVGPVAPAPPAAVTGEGPRLRIVDDVDQSAPDVGDRVAVEPGRWSGTDRPGHEITLRYRWERCTASGCSEVPGRAGVEEAVTVDDAGTQLRVVVTATSPAGSDAQATPRLGVTRAAAAAATGTPPAPPDATVPAAGTGTGAGDAAATPAGALGLPAGSLLAPGACQTVMRRSLAAAGVTLAVPAGTASAATPLAANLRIRRPRAIRKVTVTLGGRRVRLARRGRGRQVALLRPALLARTPTLQLAVVPRRGRPARAVTRLGAKPCEALLTARLRGTRLSLRVDQRSPLARVAFTLPRGLALRVTGGRAGTIGVLAFGSTGRTVMAARVGAELQVSGRTLTVVRLPAQPAAVTLDVTLAGRGRRGRSLRFGAAAIAADGATRRLATSVSVRR